MRLHRDRLAREIHGDEFHGITHSERVEDEQFAARMRGYQIIAHENARELDARVNQLESADNQPNNHHGRANT